CAAVGRQPATAPGPELPGAAHAGSQGSWLGPGPGTQGGTWTEDRKDRQWPDAPTPAPDTPQRRRAGGGVQWPRYRAGDDPQAVDCRQGKEPLGQGCQGRQPDHPAAQEWHRRYMGEARLHRAPALAVRRAADW